MPNLSTIGLVVANHNQKFMPKPGAGKATSRKRPVSTNKTERISPPPAPTPQERVREGMRRATATVQKPSSRVTEAWANRPAQREGSAPFRPLPSAQELLNKTQQRGAIPPAPSKTVHAPAPVVSFASSRPKFDPDSVTQGFSERKDYNRRPAMPSASSLLNPVQTAKAAAPAPTVVNHGPSIDLSRFDTPTL
jgi:hypothetical protein